MHEFPKAVRVGFTGTELGMTEHQKNTFKWLIQQIQPTYFSHGDCVGADDEAADIVDNLNLSTYIICHPPAKNKLRAYNNRWASLRPTKSYLARDRDIVAENDVIIATPAESVPQSRGGTWYTIRYGKSVGKPVYIINPDGSILLPNDTTYIEEEKE